MMDEETKITFTFNNLFLFKNMWTWTTTRRKKTFFNQLVFNYMSSSTLFQLHNNIYFLNSTWMGWHLKWVDMLISLVSVQHWTLMGVDRQNVLKIYITQLKSNWEFHFAMTLCHVKSIVWLFWWTLFLNEWKKDIDGWNITCIFNCISALIIITYNLPT